MSSTDMDVQYVLTMNYNGFVAQHQAKPLATRFRLTNSF